MGEVLAIIPCYNEAENLKYVIDDLIEKTESVDFIVINDGSGDDTGKICAENNYPVINLPFNLGLANAVQTGMRYAHGKGYEFAMQFDGDGQHMPEYISCMVKMMREVNADIVIGSRYVDKKSWSIRGLGKWFLRVAIRLTTGKKITDPTSGMRLFNRKMIEKFAMEMNHGPEPDTLVYLINMGANVSETQVEMRERLAGKSYLGPVAAASYMLRMFISIIIIQWFRAKEDLV